MPGQGAGLGFSLSALKGVWGNCGVSTRARQILPSRKSGLGHSFPRGFCPMTPKEFKTKILKTARFLNGFPRGFASRNDPQSLAKGIPKGQGCQSDLHSGQKTFPMDWLLKGSLLVSPLGVWGPGACRKWSGRFFPGRNLASATVFLEAFALKELRPTPDGQIVS